MGLSIELSDCCNTKREIMQQKQVATVRPLPLHVQGTESSLKASSLPTTPNTAEADCAQKTGGTCNDDVRARNMLSHVGHVLVLGQVCLQEDGVGFAVVARILHGVIHRVLIALHPVHFPAP